MGPSNTMWNTFFFVSKKAGAQRFIIDARASTRHFLNPPSGPLLTGEGLCHVEFQGVPETGLLVPPMSRTRLARRAFLDGCKRQSSYPKLVTLEKTVKQKRLAPDSLFYPDPATLPMGLFLGDVLQSRSHGPLYARWKCRFSTFLP